MSTMGMSTTAALQHYGEETLREHYGDTHKKHYGGNTTGTTEGTTEGTTGNTTGTLTLRGHPYDTTGTPIYFPYISGTLGGGTLGRYYGDTHIFDSLGV